MDPTILGALIGVCPAIAAVIADRTQTSRKLKRCEKSHQDCQDKTVALETRVIHLENLVGVKA
jgi:hypothetical protein